MIEHTTPIAESKDFIVLDKYIKQWNAKDSYQSEDELERELVQDLRNQGYEYRPDLKDQATMLANVRVQIETLNKVTFSDDEWHRFVEHYLDKPNDGIIEKSKKVHENHIHDFVFDDGHIQNIHLFDKKNIMRNKLQVIKQFEQTGIHDNRYDVTILVNGLPLIHVELKKRGEDIKEAFNQIHRYSKESFNSENSLYKFIQIFAISNGTNTRYFANTTKRNKNSFDFTMNWAKSDNSLIKDLKDFTATFFQKNTTLNILFKYSVLDINNTLLVMRPYQIAATERILWKITSSFQSKTWSKPESGGFIWHTTGSGKTLTSFKAAQLATELTFIDKVFFVVDRKDLDYQTMKEYQRFSPDSVNGSDSTAGLKNNIEKIDSKIIVTTIQKLNNLMKTQSDLAAYNQQVVFIFDECHRSQFGEAQKNINKKFKRFYQFGFTGTPIFKNNTLGTETTEDVFGVQLHSYLITDAIRDEKVLKFKVDYNDVRPKFKMFETEQDITKISTAENKKALLHPERIKEISNYILNNYHRKTHRLHADKSGFNAMFAVSSIDAAKLYYEALNKLQADTPKPLKIATIFSFAANEEQDAIGNIEDESFDITALNSSAKEFLRKAVNDYNKMFNTNFTVDSQGFQNYYRDVASRVQSKEIDLIIVVGMFLTGFDAPKLNTLFVDKNLRYHSLIQAFSRTNRIFDATKTFGNIVCFRDLQQATIEAITLFGDSNTKNVVLERSYKDYMNGFVNPETGIEQRGYITIVQEITERFPNPELLVREKDKKAFARLFGEYLRVEAVLKNYDEFSALKTYQNIDTSKIDEVEKFKQDNHLTDSDIEHMKIIDVPSERTIQNCKSTYHEIHEWLHREKTSKEEDKVTIDWNDVVFEIDLLKSQEINLDYILGIIFEKNKHAKSKGELIHDITEIIRSSIGHRSKEGLVVEYIQNTDLETIRDKATAIDTFFAYARTKQDQDIDTLIQSENLEKQKAKRYILASINQHQANDNGDELNQLLPKMSPLNPLFRAKKTTVFGRIKDLVEKYKGVGG
jgi:type I restriction enzyme R subunit